VVMNNATVNVALPQIQGDFHASLSDLQWVIDAYALTLAAGLLTAGSLADLFGRRLLFAIGTTIFTVMSALAADHGARCRVSTSNPRFSRESHDSELVGAAPFFLCTQEVTGSNPVGSTDKEALEPPRCGSRPPDRGHRNVAEALAQPQRWSERKAVARGRRSRSRW